MNRYFTGLPCKAGHIAERYKCNRRCVECQRQALLKNRKNNPERTRELRKLHKDLMYERHKERLLAAQKEWREKNKELVKKSRKDNYRRNKGARISYNAEYQRANPQKCSSWRRNYVERNPEKKRAARREYQARKVGAMPPWANREDIAAIYSEAERLTKATGIKHHVDHIHPLRGKNFCGLHVAYNLQVLPEKENLRKGNRL